MRYFSCLEKRYIDYQTILFYNLIEGTNFQGGSKMGRFVIRYKDTGLDFELQDNEGHPIATSQTYASIVTCKRAIRSIKACASVAQIEYQDNICKHPKFEIYKNENGKYHFRLKAKNAQVILLSFAYETYEECEQTVLLVKQHIINAPMIEENN